jgi:hypothetical protein
LRVPARSGADVRTTLRLQLIRGAKTLQRLNLGRHAGRVLFKPVKT